MGTDGELLATLPIELSSDTLEEGRDLFNAFCSPCHDYLGGGNGMIVQRGFKQPTSFHNPRLRESPVGYFYDVMTNGFGDMSSYAAQIQPQDRWAIAAYVKVLQLSQNVPAGELTADERRRLTTAAPAATGEAPAAEHAEPAAETEPTAETVEPTATEGAQS
jgi:mono/diheme cytochrome c family protein